MRRCRGAVLILALNLLILVPAGARPALEATDDPSEWRIIVSPPRPVAGVKLVAGAPSGCLRFQVSPRDTRIYVDGRFVGTVDQFDGWPGKLYLPPGEYRLRLNGPRGQAWRGRVEVREYHQVSIRLQHA